MRKLLHKKNITYLICLFLCINDGFAQNILDKQLTEFSELLTAEKIHVHTDRTYYQPG